MATKGIVGIGTADGYWSGVICKSDGYPRGLGKEVWDYAKDSKNRRRMRTMLSCFGDWDDFLLSEKNPLSHGIDSNWADPISFQWIYLLDPRLPKLHILKGTATDYKLKATLDLRQTSEPNWNRLD